jgi:hypothetical protein
VRKGIKLKVRIDLARYLLAYDSCRFQFWSKTVRSVSVPMSRDQCTTLANAPRISGLTAVSKVLAFIA